MKVIVGLGNIGKEYDNTRHNVGFMLLDYLTSKLNLEKFIKKKHFYVSENFFNNEKYLFIKPSDYMNLSGIAIKEIISFYKLEIKDLLVIYDELNIPLGKYKLSLDINSGGHNGVKHIVETLNIRNFLKLRIGIRPFSNKVENIKDFVLEKFLDEEINILLNLYSLFESIIYDFISDHEVSKLFNKFNKSSLTI